MNQRILWAVGHGTVLLVVLFGVAVFSGYWDIPIALAPTGYYLVFAPNYLINSPKSVVVSHLLALLAGWRTYAVIVPDIIPTAIEPYSGYMWIIALRVLVAFTVSTGLFVILDTRHSMAYVTSFVAAIGALPTLQALTVAAITVVLIAGIQTLRREVGPESIGRPAL